MFSWNLSMKMINFLKLLISWFKTNTSIIWNRYSANFEKKIDLQMKRELKPPTVLELYLKSYSHNSGRVVCSTSV